MADEPASVAAAEAVAAQAVETAAEIATAEAGAVVAAVVEGAAAQIEEAQQVAEDVIRASMETHLGQEIARTNERFTQWLDGEGRTLVANVASLQSQMAELMQQVAATAAVAVSALETSPQLIPPVSEAPLTETVEAVTEILPEAIAPEPAPVESTPNAPRRKVRVFL